MKFISYQSLFSAIVVQIDWSEDENWKQTIIQAIWVSGTGGADTEIYRTRVEKQWPKPDITFKYYEKPEH